MLVSVRGFTPEIGKDCFLAEGSIIIGDVIIEERSSVWYNVTIRGDVSSIRIGRETNIQDGTVIHGTYEKWGVDIGDRVTVGHMVMLHGCEIGYGCLVGMGSIIMDGAKIGARSIVGAGSLVTEGQYFEEGSLILGRPAKFVRKLKPEELAALEKSADNYLLYKTWYAESP